MKHLIFYRKNTIYTEGFLTENKVIINILKRYKNNNENYLINALKNNKELIKTYKNINLLDNEYNIINNKYYNKYYNKYDDDEDDEENNIFPNIIKIFDLNYKFKNCDIYYDYDKNKKYTNFGEINFEYYETNNNILIDIILDLEKQNLYKKYEYDKDFDIYIHMSYYETPNNIIDDYVNIIITNLYEFKNNIFNLNYKFINITDKTNYYNIFKYNMKDYLYEENNNNDEFIFLCLNINSYNKYILDLIKNYNDINKIQKYYNKIITDPYDMILYYDIDLGVEYQNKKLEINPYIEK